MGDSKRKCAKCNASTAHDSKLILHRFPKPGPSNVQRLVAWAKFCYPEENWNSVEFQRSLFVSHKMLCSKHFPESAFVQDHLQRKKLHRYSIPSELSTTSTHSSQIEMSIADTGSSQQPGTASVSDSIDLSNEIETQSMKKRCNDNIPVLCDKIIGTDMARCMNCTIAIHFTQQYQYKALSMSPEIVSIIEEWTAKEVTDADRICQECINLLLIELNNRNEHKIGDRQLGHQSVCVRCGRSIARRTGRRSHPLPDGQPERAYIASIINPRQIPANARACDACWQSAHRNVHEVMEPPREAQVTDDNAESRPSSAAEPGVGVSSADADADDSGPVEEPRVDGIDIFEDVDDDGDDDADTLVESNVCRVCLALDVKMYDLKDIELREMFQNITGIAVTENNHSLIERLCWECAGRLKAAAAFRNKALLSDALLQGLANTGGQIRKKDITLIKENEDYLKSAGTLSIIEVFNTVEIDPENESLPSIPENNDRKIVQNTRTPSMELKESIIEENNDEMDVEDESMIEIPIKTEIEYDHVCPNTAEENRNIDLETNPLFINNIPLREDTINSAYSSPLPGCSHVEPKYPILDHLKIASGCELNKIKKTVIKIINTDPISKIVSKKSKEVISHDHTLKCDAKLKNINVTAAGISKKTSNRKLVKKTQVKANTSMDEEYLSLENFEF